MNRTGTRIQLAANCTYRPGAFATVTGRYLAGRPNEWLIIFDDGKDMAIRERDIAVATMPESRKVLSFGR